MIENYEELYKKHEKHCDNIINMYKNGLTVHQIGSSIQCSDSFVEDILKKGKDRYLTELLQILNLSEKPISIIPEKPNEQHTQKNEIHKSKTEVTKKSSHEKCPSCKSTTLVLGEPYIINKHNVKTFLCTQCNNMFYNPDDFTKAMSA